MMENVRNLLSMTLVVGGVLFFLAATAGLIRFPDASCRIHAVSKADNAGLGLVVLGALVQAGSMSVAVKLLAIWLLALIASALVGQLLGRAAKAQGGPP